MSELQAEPTAAPKSEASDRLQFEALLADLSARFVNMPVDRVDQEIVNAQRLLCECLRLERSSLWQRTQDEPDELVLTHLCGPPPGVPLPPVMKASEFYPWILRRIFTGQAVAIADIAKLPPEAARDRESLQRYGIKSVLALPLTTDGGLTIGVLSFSGIHRPREWPDPIVTRCKLLAQVFAGALARKRAEQALRESEQRFRRLIDQAPVAISISRAGRTIYVNQKYVDMYGFRTVDELVGQSIFDQWAPGSREIVRENSRKRTRGEPVAPEYEETGQRKDGSQFPVHIVIKTVDLPDGPAFLAFLSDITERKRAEEAIRASEQRFRELADLLPQPVYEADRSGRLTFANRQAASAFGYELEALERGIRISELLCPEDREQAASAVADVLRGGRTTGNQYTAMRKDGTSFPVLIYSSPIVRDGHVEGIRGVLVDITERVRLEEIYRQQQNELAHMARVLAAGEMASSLAHELNQPLAAILNYSEAARRALESGRQPEVLADALDEIGKEAVRAGEIIRRIRSFFRYREPQRQAIDITSAVRETFKVIEFALTRAGVHPRLELAQGLATASCDSVQVQQVLINLIQNAVAAMTDQKPSERRLVIRTAPGDGVVQVSVIDTGCGLPPELRERVFEPFMTTKPDGLGIGLSICRGIIESHGGRITATANPDKGTTFRFTLRLA